MINQYTPNQPGLYAPTGRVLESDLAVTRGKLGRFIV